MGGQPHSPAALSSGKTRCQLCSRLRGIPGPTTRRHVPEVLDLQQHSCEASLLGTDAVYCVIDQLKCDGTRSETIFRLSAKRTSPFKSAGASVRPTTGSRGVRISGSNAGYTTFRGSVKCTGYPLHSPVSPSILSVFTAINLKFSIPKCYNIQISTTGQSITQHFIYNGIYVRATCFDLVGHLQALQEKRSKSCLDFLNCGIPNAYNFPVTEAKVHQFV